MVNRTYVFVILVVLCGAFLASCASENVLTEEEIRTQNAADTVVANLLFDRGLTNTASYNVHKNGYVVIHFDKSVKSSVYTDVVETLRANNATNGVYADQEGVEVCPPR
ncbi:MAG: hypothetical protein P8Y28_16075 [Gammaproteobacteria bacterium]|jgi:hypothetical protein